MRIVRLIMAFLITLSVAMLPTVGSAMSVAATPSQGASAKLSVADDMSAAMDECCPEHAKDKPCDQPRDQCPLPCCAAQPISIAVAAGFHFNVPIVPGYPLSLPADQVVSLHSGSPPFRPPRV